MFARGKWLGVVVFLMGLLFFVQPVWAAAKVEAVGTIPTVSKYASNVALATARIYDDASAKWAENGQPVTIWLPGEVTYVKVPTASTLGYYVALETEGVDLNFITGGENFLTVSVTDGVYQVKNVSVSMKVYFDQEGYSEVNTGEISGDLKVLIEAPNTIFDLKEGVVGKTAGQGLSIESRTTPTIAPGTYNAKAGQIKVFENCLGAVKADSEIVLTASKGVSFAKVEMIPYLGWGGNDIEVLPVDQTADGLSRARLKVKKDTSAGKYKGAVLLDIWYNVPSEFTGKEIKVTLVRTSEVVVIGVNEVANAEVADLGVEVSADDPATAVIFAGRTGTGATIFLEENKAGSLAPNRTVELTLPDKFAWNGRPAVAVTAGDIKLDAGTISSDKRKVTFTVTASSTSASTIELCEPDYDVDPDAPAGGVAVTIGGTAGATGEVINAEVIKPFDMAAEKAEMKVGVQAQGAGTITITENKEKAFMKESPTQDGKIIITTPAGVTISGMPEVKVTEGNVKINQQDIRLEDLGDRSRLTIPVTAESSKPSALEISGLKYTLSRMLPEGDIAVIISGSAMHTVGDEVYKLANAVCVTPAPSGSGAAQFVIGSASYLVNGASYAMDAAPYVKNGRTYLPVRYLAYVLGVTPQSVGWDASSRAVTLTRDATTVKLTVGSATMEVNDQEETMDVVAEINKGRLMLPARWVAEALGAKVGWDKTRRTVTVAR